MTSWFRRGAAPRSLGTAIAVLALRESSRLARTLEVTRSEERVFRWFNGAPNQIHIPAWVVMQSGSLAGVFVAAGELARRGRPRTATAAALAGTAVWGGVKLIKPHVGRGRPEHHLDDVSVRGQAQTGLGYPSGHAAVALTLALIASRSSGRTASAAAMTLAGVVGGTRMYVGAHLPLDVAGGFAIGMLSGTATRAILAVCP